MIGATPMPEPFAQSLEARLLRYVQIDTQSDDGV